MGVPARVCGMGLLNLDQETAFGSGEASSVLAAGEQEKPRVGRNQDQVLYIAFGTLYS